MEIQEHRAISHPHPHHHHHHHRLTQQISLGNPAPASGNSAVESLKLSPAARTFHSQQTLQQSWQEAVGPSPAVPSGAPGEISQNARAAYDQLIKADFRTAHGREPDEKEYAYWMKLLSGPCDSGFVKSGEMSGTEYWHRRMLGWQAGGADIVPFGPYAGDGQDHGRPVPAAGDVVPGVPRGGATNGVSEERVNDLSSLISRDLQTAYGRTANERDLNYWLDRFLSPCDAAEVRDGSMSSTEYYHRRLLGWKAGGQDIATSGPYACASEAHEAVPSYQDVLGGEIRP